MNDLDLKGFILSFTYISVGLALYMAVHNIKLWVRVHWPRRVFYAIAYGSVAGLLWEIATYIVEPAPRLPGDPKTVFFLIFLIGFTVGMVGIFYDHYKRRKAGQNPPAG